MSNLREEVLKSVLKKIQLGSENLMLEINILLSRPEGVENIVDKISDLMIKLSINETALSNAQTLLIQSIQQRMSLEKKEENDTNS